MRVFLVLFPDRNTTIVKHRSSNGLLSYLRSCRFASISAMRMIFAPIPNAPRLNMTVASVIPPGWHWNTLVALDVTFPEAPMPNLRLAPIIATAEPAQEEITPFNHELSNECFYDELLELQRLWNSHLKIRKKNDLIRIRNI